MQAQALPIEREAEMDDAFEETVVTMHPQADRSQNLRVIEAMLFASADPVGTEKFQEFLPAGTDVLGLLNDLQTNYENRGVNLVQVAGKWALRTAQDMIYIAP